MIPDAMERYDEAEVLEWLRIPERQHEAFNRIVRHYSKPLYWQIRKMVLSHDDADDLLQNCFLKAWDNLDYFRGEAKLSTWLYRIAINETLTFLQKERKQHTISIDDDVYLEEHLTADGWFSGDDAQRKLQQAILRLPEKQRLVFNMRYFDELKYEEIAERVGTSVGALKASYHLAVKKIEQYLSEND